MADDFHLSMSLGHVLWEDFLRAALPVTLSEGSFELVQLARAAIGPRVSALLEGPRTPGVVARLSRRARTAWRERRVPSVRWPPDLVRVDGTWRVELDGLGTRIVYGPQRLTADAFLRGTVEGRLSLWEGKLVVPVRLERRIGASLALADVGFDASRQAIVGTLRDVGLHVSEATWVKLVASIGEVLLERQLSRINPVPVLPRAQVSELVGSLGAPMQMKMDIEAMDLHIDGSSLSLRIRFGFGSSGPARRFLGDDPER